MHEGVLMLNRPKRTSISWMFICGLVFLLAACASPAAEPEVEAQQPSSEISEAVETNDEAVIAEDSTVPSNDSHSQFVDTSRYDEFEIITLLPPDAIPAIDNPTFHTADEADDYYEPDELVMGVVFNGDARAYSVPHLSSHEIVNDEVGGVKIAVTW